MCSRMNCLLFHFLWLMQMELFERPPRVHYLLFWKKILTPFKGYPPQTTIIVDAMAMVQMINVVGVATFGVLAEKYWEAFTRALSENDSHRIDIVSDRYDKKHSIKEQTRLKRGSFSSLEIKIAGENTPIPSQWSKFLSNPVNKANLTHFLCQRWNDACVDMLAVGKTVVLARVFRDPLRVVKLTFGNSKVLDELLSDHEEADTRMILHALHTCQDHDRVIIQSPDTDVAVIGIHSFTSLHCRELWFRTGTKDKLRYLPIHTIANHLDPSMCAALPGFHSLTGCDSTSALFGIGKKKGFDLLRASPEHQKSMSQLGDGLELSTECQVSC